MNIPSLLLLSVLVVFPTQGGPTVCPNTWTLPANDSSNNCECGSDIDGIVHCDIQTKQVYIHKCYCMTVAEDETTLVVGLCLYNCWHNTYADFGYSYYPLPSDKQNVTDYICGEWNRRGELCGNCKEGYSPPILSYDLKCMRCDTDNHNTGWIKLIVAGFLPVTVFYILALVFRLNANSARLNGFILFAQIVSAPPFLHFFTAGVLERNLKSVQSAANIILIPYGIWNLDFLITVLPQFCIPELGTLQVFTVQLFIAAYPLLLILITYILVELHARNVRVVVVLWKPFHKCSVRIRKQLGIKTSIIDVFATFFLLSYTKTTSYSVDMLTINSLWDTSGNVVKLGNYYVGGRIHYTWYILPGTLIIIQTFLVVLMLLYPMKCFQNCLGKSCCRGCSLLALKAFMDCFLGYFKDGTDGTRNCGYVAGYYFVVRIVVWITYALLAHDRMYLPFFTGIFAISAVLIALIHPYKKQYQVHNITDPIAFLLLGLLIVCVDLWNTRAVHNHSSTTVVILLTGIIVLIPLIYLSIVALISFRDARLVRRVIDVVKRRKRPVQESDEAQSLVNK